MVQPLAAGPTSFDAAAAASAVCVPMAESYNLRVLRATEPAPRYGNRDRTAQPSPSRT